MEATPISFGPIAALRAIRQVSEDRELSHAQRAVVIAIILRARNGDGLAWGGYRSLATDCSVSTSTVRQALKAADGKHIQSAGIGKQGAKRYRVIAQRRAKRSGEESAAVSEAQRGDQQSASAAVSAHILAPTTSPSSCPSGTSAPPDPFTLTPNGEAKGNGQTGELVALWACGFNTRTGQPLAGNTKGRIAGMLKNLLRDLPTELVKAAIGRWFGADRESYGIGLFKRKLEDGDADLTGRRVNGNSRMGKKSPGGFNPAPTGQSYNGLAKTFK